MNLLDAIDKFERLPPVTVPELRYLSAAADRVLDRWPDIQLAGTEKERESLAQKLRDRVERADWKDTPLSFVVAAASAVFDTERRDRPDLDLTRGFIYAETAASTSETFLSGLFRAYIGSFVPMAPHSIALGEAISEASPKLSSGLKNLLNMVPELLDTASGPGRLAERMAKMSDPYTELLRLGVRTPHGSGFMDYAHISLTSLVRPHLSERNLIDWYVRWLRPPGKEEGRNTGADVAIEAMIHPWLDSTPEDELRSYLVEILIELYGDPRIKSGGVWAGIGERYIATVHRWLTREDMRFFTGVVDATQKDAMWPPRRDFWLQLYDERKIDAAWAALSKEGFQYAIANLMRQDAKNAYTRVGFQRARQNTSLLIMQIGNKIMVDGCHSYRTHVFDIADPMAPKLFGEGYDCEEIRLASDRRASGASKSHSSIPSWKRWVRDMINADVPRSNQTRAYSYVARPRPPRPRGTPPSRSVTASYPNRQAAHPAVGTSSSGQDYFSTGTVTNPPSTPDHGPAAKVSAPPASATAEKRVHVEVPKPDSPKSFNPISLRETRFPNLTDRMIAYGPTASDAVLAYFENPDSRRTRPLLSPKSREGLAWVREKRSDLPLRLRNALEYLLISLKTSGVDLDDLFAASVTPTQETVREAPSRDRALPADQGQGLPPLPDTPEERLNLLLAHADTLDEAGMWIRTFEDRKDFRLAFGKLKNRSPDLRPAELAKLQFVYEWLRRREKKERK